MVRLIGYSGNILKLERKANIFYNYKKVEIYLLFIILILMSFIIGFSLALLAILIAILMVATNMQRRRESFLAEKERRKRPARSPSPPKY